MPPRLRRPLPPKRPASPPALFRPPGRGLPARSRGHYAADRKTTTMSMGTSHGGRPPGLSFAREPLLMRRPSERERFPAAPLASRPSQESRVGWRRCLATPVVPNAQRAGRATANVRPFPQARLAAPGRRRVHSYAEAQPPPGGPGLARGRARPAICATAPGAHPRRPLPWTRTCRGATAASRSRPEGRSSGRKHDGSSSAVDVSSVFQVLVRQALQRLTPRRSQRAGTYRTYFSQAPRL